MLSDIQNRWYSVSLGLQLRTCVSCDLSKPVDCFNNTDRTCKLCRKLISLGIKYKSNVRMSPEAIHGSVDKVICKSCHKIVNLTDLAKNSYECQECFSVRCLTEFNHYNEIEMNIRCLNCRKPKSISEFPIGRLICRSCLRSKSEAFIH